MKNKEDIISWLNKVSIHNYSIKDDLTVDVKGDVNLISLVKLGLIGEELPIKFGHVSGDFIVSNNQLKTLRNSPDYVGGHFNCSYNKIESLEFCPKFVGGNFLCFSNRIKNLRGCPATIHKDFDCSENLLETLENGPTSVKASYICSYNKLTHLDGLPNDMSGDLDISSNKFSQLNVSHLNIQGTFDCSENKLTNLIGIPNNIGGDIIAEYNPLVSIEGISETFKTFRHENNKTTTIKELEEFYRNGYIILSYAEIKNILLAKNLSADLKNKKDNNNKLKI